MKNRNLQTEVLIIGGGATGTGIARDLALRGIRSVLVEKKDINAGASGANHGLLHSGARYVSGDADSARECRDENELLKKMAPGCIEDIGGLFIAVEGDDESYVSEFPDLCAKSGIPITPVGIKEVREMEPALSPKIIAAYRSEDASIDPFKLSMENISQAVDLGGTLLRQTKVVGFEIRRGRIIATRLNDTLTGESFTIEADQVINASGAWADIIAGLAGISIPIVYSKGSLLVTHSRITKSVINRLRPSSNADILVPGGTVSILGTTSINIKNPDRIFPSVEEMDYIVQEGAAMLPDLEKIRYIRAYSGVRPLVGSANADDGRKVSRSFALIDHLEDGLENFTTITGGKLSTYRLMAEKTTDLVSARLGVSNPCLTKTTPLPSTSAGKWTKPGLTPRLWINAHAPEDLLVCECEMVPKSTVDSIIRSIHDQNGTTNLKAIGVRSRIGKGSCQGTFCGLRIAAYLYDREELELDRGLGDLRNFLNERWRGVRPLLWDMPLVQAELQEALYCGFLGLEATEEETLPDLY